MTPFQTFISHFNALRISTPVSPILLVALTVAVIFCIDNTTFWSLATQIFEGHPASFAGYMLAIAFLAFGVFSLFAFPWVVKPLLVFIVVLSAVTSYYMDSLGVIVDRDMIQNVMVTTLTESKHLITISFLAHVSIYGVLPAIAIMLVKIKRHSALKTVAAPILTFFICMALAAGLLMADLKSYASILRERKDFMSSFQPGAPLVGAIRYVKMISGSVNVPVAAIGEDAKKGPSFSPSAKPVLTVVVAGETARSQNFSLNGYGVETNPKLAKLPVINFEEVTSCGTATAVSLPCMFSKFPRKTYSYKQGISHENVLDVLSHAGFHVEWWDNNTGHKDLADRIVERSFTHTPNDEFCAAGECMDGIFIQALKDYAASITQDTVLVLHHIGSHGPTYYLRYPEKFERFKPACRTAEFKKCSAEEITNAYDNTIAYTDEILAQTIDLLEDAEGLATAMLYVSDHGESLGEGGLYLHGSPYFLAPEYQTKVPMILWMSETFKTQLGIDQDCLSATSDRALSHDNLFHSILGMLDVETIERDPDLDVFAACKSEQRVARK
jgi:lipid A ethanolaminephosphotransferase